MPSRVAKKIDIEASSGNVFEDLGLRDADQLKIKSGLTIEIVCAVRRVALTQQQTAKRMGISQAKVSGLMRGDFSNLRNKN